MYMNAIGIEKWGQRSNMGKSGKKRHGEDLGMGHKYGQWQRLPVLCGMRKVTLMVTIPFL